MARTYADTPNSTSEVNGSDILVVQQGDGTGSVGFPQMKKTTLSVIKEYMNDGIASAIVFKGSITWDALQSLTGMRVGDMYNVTDREGQNYAWTGTTWDALGETKDLSGIETRLAAEEEKSEELGGKVSDLEEATGRLTSSLTEVSAVSKNTEGRLTNVESAVDFVLNDKAVVSGNRVNIPSSEDLAPNGVVKGMEGESVTSRNLWDEEWEVVGGNLSPTNYIPAKPSTYYFVTFKNWGTFICYDSSKNRVGDCTYSEKGTGYVIRTLANTSFIKFTTYGYGTTYNHDIAIFEGSDAIPYEPHFDGIRHATIEGYKSRGANIWDEETEAGFITDSGYSDNGSSLRSKNFTECSPNTDYYKVKPSTYTVTVVLAFYDASKNLIKRGTNATKDTSPATARYFKVSLYNYGTVYKNDIAIRTTEGGYEPYQSSPVTFSEPIELKKGDVLEPMTGRVMENYGVEDLSKLAFVQVETGLWRLNGYNKIPVPSNLETFDGICEKYTVVPQSAIGSSVNAISYNSNLYVKSTDKPNGLMVYRLIEPTYRDISPLPSTISVYKGGEVSLNGNGLGKMTLEVTKLEVALQTRVKSLESQVKDLQDENAEQNDRITNLEYENRITKAVLAKKIAEETTLEGEVINFPSTGEDGYPLADWGLLKMLKSESLVWNQVFNHATAFFINTGLSFNRMADGIVVNGTASTYSHNYQNMNLNPSHVYAVICNDYRFNDGSTYNFIYLKKSDGGSNIEVTDMVVRTGIVDVDIRLSATTFNNKKFVINVVDMTQLFGVTEVSAVTEAMKTFVRTYAEAHPEYDTGTLLDSVYERGVSRGANLINEEYLAEQDPAHIARMSDGSYRVSIHQPMFSSGFVLPNVGKAVTISMDIKVLNATNVRLHFGNGSTALVGASNSANSTTEWTRVYLTSSAGVDKFCFDWSAGGDFLMRNVTLVEGNSYDYIPSLDSHIDLSFLKGVPGIGIKDTVIDFEKEVVRWKWNKVVFNGTEGFNATSSYVYCTKRVDKGFLIPPYYRMNNKNSVNADLVWFDESATIVQFNRISNYAGVTDNTDTIGLKAYLKEHPLELVYELATPITKTFSDLGIVIPDSWDGGKPWVRVEAGGTFTVVSSGAEAEATVSFLTDLGGN